MSDCVRQSLEIDIEFAKEKLFDCLKLEWNSQIYASPKLRTYVLYKNTYETECYLNFLVNRGYRSVLAQFRTGVLPLAVETGRFNNIPIEYRLCTFCHENVLEDEIHFLLFVRPIMI